ncbi:MAG: TAXI family TRAP transporter solute-binding subunit [Desulfobacterales bacterium]|nr:TAXI family TRAP transporter solute-binding subunit [Desulfobacterales bacterium]
MTIKRYNAGVQRAKGLLEMASSLFESSLSSESWRAAEGVLQTDSRVGHGVRLSLGSGNTKEISLTMATGGFPEVLAVGEGKLSLAWVNPSVSLTLAHRGKGFFPRPLALRTLAVFPSYDIMAFAVHESTGITSLSQIKKDRFPLNISTRQVDPTALRENSTMFTVGAVMAAAGFAFEDIRQWGGNIHLSVRPSDPARRNGIESGQVTAVFDEGIKSWIRTALENGFRFLPVEGDVMARLKEMGYRPAILSKSRYEDLPGDVQTVDFSGWPMIVHAEMPDEVAYALCEAIESRQEVIPTDNYKPLDMTELCNNGEETPYDVPLHPGAERFYREKGYLK